MQPREMHFNSLCHAIERMLRTEEGRKQIEKVKATRFQFIKEHSHAINDSTNEPV